MKREIKRRSRLRPVVAAIFLCGIFLCGRAGSAYAQEQPTNEEYRVYEAALHLMTSIPKTDLHVAIYDRTLNGKCGAEGDNPVMADGCTFLWVKPDTSDDVEQKLRAGFHGLERSTWKNFKASNAASITLHDPISTPWKHRLTGTTTPGDGSKEWESPDMTIFLSRVGFNSKKTEAIVYVLVFSYVGRTAATGDYLRFRAGPDKTWSLAGRVNYLTQDDNSFAGLQPGAKSGHRVPDLRAQGLRTPGLRTIAEWK
jgi:hypothetical protein